VEEEEVKAEEEAEEEEVIDMLKEKKELKIRRLMMELNKENHIIRKIENMFINIMRSIKEMQDKNIIHLIENQELEEEEDFPKMVMERVTGERQKMM